MCLEWTTACLVCVVSVGVSGVDDCMSCVCGECWCIWSGRLHVLCVCGECASGVEEVCCE